LQRLSNFVPVKTAFVFIGTLLINKDLTGFKSITGGTNNED
jgi:hypothetical protein